MKLLAIGDNLIDYYQDQGLIYPGGNALNVAVMSKRNGMEQSGYIGIFGNDKPSKYILQCLNRENIDISRCRYAIGETGKATIKIDNDGDRVFIGTNRGTRIQSQLKIHLNETDIRYIEEFDIVHLSVNSDIDDEIVKFSKKEISYDFSTKQKWSKKLIRDIGPYIDYGFFSGSDFTKEKIIELFTFCHEIGMKLVCITRGENTALLSDGTAIYEQKPLPTNLVDTMGAGDSFIAGFLSYYTKYRDVRVALKNASKSSAQTCSYNGAIGYPLKISKLVEIKD